MKTIFKSVLRLAFSFLIFSPITTYAIMCKDIFGELKSEPLKQSSLSFKEFRVSIKKGKSESPNYTRVTVTIGDGYQSSLVENHGWTETFAERMDEQIYASLAIFGAVVRWEDLELFEVELPLDIKDPVQTIRDAIVKIMENPISLEVLDRNETNLSEAKRAYEASVQNARASDRTDSTLLDEYSQGGYLVAKVSAVRKRKALEYSEQEFLMGDPNLLKIATKPGSVILKISLSGTSFRKIYGSWVIPKNQLYGGYQSKVEQIVKSLDTSGQQVYHLIKKAITRDGNDESITILTTQNMAIEIIKRLSEIAKP